MKFFGTERAPKLERGKETRATEIFLNELFKREQTERAWIRGASSISAFPQILGDPKVKVVMFLPPPHTHKIDFELFARKKQNLYLGRSSYPRRFFHRLAAERAIAAFELEKEEVRSAFPDAKFDFSESLLYDRHNEIKMGNWHLDGKKFVRDYSRFLRMIRIFSGRSTWYAEDTNGSKAVEPPDGAITIHRMGPDGAIHKRPSIPAGMARFAIITDIILKEPLAIL